MQILVVSSPNCLGRKNHLVRQFNKQTLTKWYIILVGCIRTSVQIQIWTHLNQANVLLNPYNLSMVPQPQPNEIFEMMFLRFDTYGLNVCVPQNSC